MQTYLHNIYFYFEQVLHPAAGKEMFSKKKRKSGKTTESGNTSPESYNTRGHYINKQDKLRRSPAP